MFDFITIILAVLVVLAYASLAVRLYQPGPFWERIQLVMRGVAGEWGAVAVAIPDTSEGLAEILMDDKRRGEIFADGEATKEFLAAYVKATNKADKGQMATQIAEQAAASVMDMLRENGVQGRLDQTQVDDLVSKLRPASPAAGPRGLYNPKALGAKVDSEFPDFSSYFATIWHGADPADANVAAKRHTLRNAFGSTVPSEGGFLVPERLRAELLRVALETAIVRPRARIIPMDSARVPFPAIDASSNASSVFGGIVGYWTEEGAALTESAASFSQILLDAKKLTAYSEAPNELLTDSIISFEAFIADILPEAIAWYEDVAFFTGTGVGEPLGFLNAAAAISVTKQSGQVADTIVWQNIAKMFSRMLPSSLGRAVWVASIDTFPELATMALSVGTGGSAVWLSNGVSGPPMTILGRPVIFTEKSPVLGDAGDISFVDFGHYLIGDRQLMTASSSPHYKFANDKTAFRVVERVDGRAWVQSAITPKNGGATLSPIVKIAARA